MRCEVAEEAIWDSARTGEPLPEAVRSHIESCEGCARIAEEADCAMSILRADVIPDAPDCRRAVHVRIGRQRSRVRVWAYAAVLALVVIALFGLLRENHTLPETPILSQEVRVVETPAPPVQEEAEVIPPPEKIAPDPPESPRPTVIQSPQRKPSPRPRAVAQAPVAAQEPEVAPIKEERDPIEAEPFTTEDDDSRAVLAFAVTWEPDTESYGYVETDLETGDQVLCLVERTGDSIFVLLESTPGEESGEGV